MSVAVRVGRRLGNRLYEAAFPAYRVLYSTFKAYADRPERQLLAGSLGPGSIVVDAGANIGIYSQFLSKCVGASGVVHGFEPAPDNFAHYRRAVAGLPNVRANQAAVSDRSGESLLYLSDELNVDHRTHATAGETRRTIPIRSVRLDDYFEPRARVDLIKMDIQGFEFHALRGAERVLSDNPGVRLLLEFWPYGLHHAGASGDALLAFLEQRNFVNSVWDGSRLVESQPSADAGDPMSYCNFLAERRPPTPTRR